MMYEYKRCTVHESLEGLPTDLILFAELCENYMKTATCGVIYAYTETVVSMHTSSGTC